MTDEQIQNVRVSLQVKIAAEQELERLYKRREEMFAIENMIQKYSEHVDISGYTLLSQIARVIAWSASGKYARTGE